MKKKSLLKYFSSLALIFIAFAIDTPLNASSITFWESKKKLGVEVKLPDWALEKEVSSTEEKGLKEDGGLYSNIKIYKPVGNKKDWTHFFSIQVENGINDPIKFFKDLQVGAYLSYCENNTILFNFIKEESDQVVFSVFCPNYKHNEEKGEIAIFSMVKFKSYFIKIFHQWQSDSIDVNKKSSWGASEKELSTVIKNISSLKIHFKK